MRNRRMNDRLDRLEREAARQAERDRQHLAAQQDLCCPLPDATTPEEFAEALSLLTAAHAAIRFDRGDLWALSHFRDYAIGLHKKYGGPFANQEPSDA